MSPFIGSSWSNQQRLRQQYEDELRREHHQRQLAAERRRYRLQRERAAARRRAEEEAYIAYCEAEVERRRAMEHRRRLELEDRSRRAAARRRWPGRGSHDTNTGTADMLRRRSHSGSSASPHSRTTAHHDAGSKPPRQRPTPASAAKCQVAPLEVAGGIMVAGPPSDRVVIESRLEQSGRVPPNRRLPDSSVHVLEEIVSG